METFQIFLQVIFAVRLKEFIVLVLDGPVKVWVFLDEPSAVPLRRFHGAGTFKGFLSVSSSGSSPIKHPLMNGDHLRSDWTRLTDWLDL